MRANAIQSGRHTKLRSEEKERNQIRDEKENGKEQWALIGSSIKQMKVPGYPREGVDYFPLEETVPLSLKALTHVIKHLIKDFS